MKGSPYAFKKIVLKKESSAGLIHLTKHLIGELKLPERAARLAVFLTSHASDSITGEIETETGYRKC